MNRSRTERAVRGGVTTPKADLIFASLPYGTLAALQKPLYDKIREKDAQFEEIDKLLPVLNIGGP